MTYIDFHAHHPSLYGERVIQDGVDTRGRHPWHLIDTPSPPSSHSCPSAPHKRCAVTHSLNSSFSHSLLAIGESGLDRLCQTLYDLQLSVFREEVALSEQLRLPLILHCVRAIDDVLRIRRELCAQQPIIWHGYRGNSRQLQQLLAPKISDELGRFYFCFGFRFNTEALLACPADRLLLETDDDTLHPIAELYAQVAQLRHISPDELVRQMHSNFHVLFEKD